MQWRVSFANAVVAWWLVFTLIYFRRYYIIVERSSGVGVFLRRAFVSFNGSVFTEPARLKVSCVFFKFRFFFNTDVVAKTPRDCLTFDIVRVIISILRRSNNSTASFEVNGLSLTTEPLRYIYSSIKHIRSPDILKIIRLTTITKTKIKHIRIMLSVSRLVTFGN